MLCTCYDRLQCDFYPFLHVICSLFFYLCNEEKCFKILFLQSCLSQVGGSTKQSVDFVTHCWHFLCPLAFVFVHHPLLIWHLLTRSKCSVAHSLSYLFSLSVCSLKPADRFVLEHSDTFKVGFLVKAGPHTM